MKTTTVNGTNDYLPREVLIRDYLQNTILNVYRNCGFERIMTPALEDIENLDKSEGGDNLNLIFKILKRGDKLEKALEAEDYKNLADIGLRYDLTLPLSRYYANNRAKLVLPMKCIQIDKVYRAERPQKGRLREFVQCDIDIIGDSSSNAEIELIATTAKALIAIGMDKFRIKVNDRRILKGILKNAGFSEDMLDSVCISFDKLDKIGADGVQAELLEKGFPVEAVNKLADIIGSLPLSVDSLSAICSEEEAISSLKRIMEVSKQLAGGKYDIVYDMSLVRGQGYYTGTIFEVESSEFRGAIGGGGRYDNLIGKFVNEQIPAVGFSIGFERIFSILRDKGYDIPDGRKRIALIYNPADYVAAEAKAEELRAEYDVSLFEQPKKLGKFLDKLTPLGYYGFFVCGQSEEIKVF